MRSFCTPKRLLQHFLTCNWLMAVGSSYLLLPASGHAQTVPARPAEATLTGTAVGRSQPSQATAPLPFATVLLRRTGPVDTSLVASAQTTLSGSFTLPAVPVGTYRLRIQALGYQSLARIIQLPPGQASLSLGELVLAAGSQQLGEVTVTSKRNVVQQELGKTVINVEQDLVNAGGTVVDALQNVPSVAVSPDGTVSLRGSSNLTILVDGKPTQLSNGGTGPQLAQLPTAQLARIEISTNPSAKYQASGTGVINLITKQNQKNGWEGQASLYLGTQRKFIPALALSRRQGPATWTLNYDARDSYRTSDSHDEQTARLPDGSRLSTTQAGPGSFRVQLQSVELGVRYVLSPEHTLHLTVSPHWEQQAEQADQTLTQQPAGTVSGLTQLSTQHVELTTRALTTAADYRRTWVAHPGRELTAAVGVTGFTGPATVQQTLAAGTYRTGFEQAATYQEYQYYGQADYVQPAVAGGKLEAGFLTQIRRNNSSLRNALTDQRDSLRTSMFAYQFTEVLPATYLTYQRALGKHWETQVGLRAEYTSLQGAGTGRTLGLHYLNLFPTATVARTLGSETAPARLQLSYARRINRPGFEQQLPLAIYQDPRNYQLGNPGLLPELSHNLELGYELTRPGGATLTATAFGRFTENAIQLIRTVDTLATRTANVGVVTANTYLNAGRTSNLGLELSWAQPLAKWWQLAASGSLYRNQLATNAGNTLNQVALAGSARLTSNFTPRPGLDIQLTGNVRSTVLTAQGRQLPTGGLNLAVRQRLFGERAALSLRVLDLLNTQVSRSEITTADLQSTAYTKYRTRVGLVGFTWYIGTAKVSKHIGAAPALN